MTDISKTKSELLADLADNTRERVSPQTLRNMVTSLRDPVPLGGLEGVSFNPAQEAVSAYITSQPDSVSGIEVPNNTARSIQLHPEGYVGYSPDLNLTGVYFYDPAGYVSATADPPLLYSPTFWTGGKYLKNIPPRSVWRTVMTVVWWSGTFVDSDDVTLLGCFPLANYAYPVNWLDDTSLGIYSAPIYAYSGYAIQKWGDLPATKAMQSQSIITFPDYDAQNDAFFLSPGYPYQASGETQRIRHIEIDITRLA